MLVKLVDYCKKAIQEGHEGLKVTISMRGLSYGKFYCYLVVNITSDNYYYPVFQNESVEFCFTLYEFKTVSKIYKSVLESHSIGVDIIDVNGEVIETYRRYVTENEVEKLKAIKILEKEEEKESKAWSDWRDNLWNRIWALELKLQNPKFMQKVMKMNPNGIIKETAKGKELISTMSEIDVIKRMIKSKP